MNEWNTTDWSGREYIFVVTLFLLKNVIVKNVNKIK